MKIGDVQKYVDLFNQNKQEKKIRKKIKKPKISKITVAKPLEAKKAN